MSKIVGVIIALVVLTALFAVREKLAPTTAEAVFVTPDEPATAGIFPFEIMKKSGKDLPAPKYGDPF
jgi:hypothetical protein